MSWHSLVNQSVCWFVMVVCSCFVRSLGNKLQILTSQKGVIHCAVQDDADMFFVNTADSQSILPDLIVNPHHVKCQAFINDYITRG